MISNTWDTCSVTVITVASEVGIPLNRHRVTQHPCMFPWPGAHLYNTFDAISHWPPQGFPQGQHWTATLCKLRLQKLYLCICPPAAHYTCTYMQIRTVTHTENPCKCSLHFGYSL